MPSILEILKMWAHTHPLDPPLQLSNTLLIKAFLFTTVTSIKLLFNLEKYV